MGFLPASELASIQATVNASLDLAGVQVQRLTRTPDNAGTYSETWATIATVAGGWALPTAAVMAAYAGIIGSLKSWVVRLPAGTSVQRNDRLAMPSGDILTVQADLSERSYATCVRVLATEVK